VNNAKRLNLSQLSNLTAHISAIRIPSSLAEKSFRDLQRTGFFLDLIDVLGLTILVNGHTPAEAIIASETINAIIEAKDDTLNQNGYEDRKINYHSCPPENQDYVKIAIRRKKSLNTYLFFFVSFFKRAESTSLTL